MPLAKPHLHAIALRHEQEALSNWHQGGRAFFWNVKDCSDYPGWPSEAMTEAGVVFDTLAARVSPRSFLGLLKAWLAHQKNVVLEEGIALQNLDPTAGHATLSDGRVLAFGHCVLANGVGLFDILQSLSPARISGAPFGIAVKGQAALLDANIDPDFPVIFHDGLYIIPHHDGSVAIGSTSEEEFDAPFSTDNQLEALIARAREFAPCLENAPVIERWAGLRPKAIGRDPIAGRHPEFERLFVLGGGYKISFGIAHQLAQAVIDRMDAKAGELPSSFDVVHHLEVQARKSEALL